MERLHLRITGRVQGVFFRAHTRETASSLGLTGWVRNTHDGAVEVLAEGEHPRLEALRGWCLKGPPGARVSGMEERWEPATGEFNQFSIAY